MLQNMKKYPISFWTTTGFNKAPAEKVDDWHDLGITLAMGPCDLEHKELVYEMLDRARYYDMKVILCDPRTGWRNLTHKGEDEYRKDVAEAIKDFGSHPAMFGFYIGDEPDALDAENAFKAVRINNEMAPHLIAYINLLPWFDWIGPRMGTDAYAPYLDRAVKEGNSKLLSYDCYAQMWEGKKGYKDYFNNLREYYLASKRNNVPFFNIVLSCGHYEYRCPTKDDMLWQLTTSVAHGAAGVSWFFIELPGIWDNYRNAPINQLGDRTEQFGWLREVNCVFNNYCGEIINNLTIDECYHAIEAFGGMPMFEPFGCIIDVKSSSGNPLVISGFHNDEGEKFYVVCNNSPEKSSHVSLKIKGGVKLMAAAYGNTFQHIHHLSDPIGEKMVDPEQSIGFYLAPGQLKLLKEVKE